MSEDRNKAIVRRFIEDGWNEGNLSVIDDACAPNFLYHDPADPHVRNLEAYKRFFAAMHNGYPDMRVALEDVIAEGDMVVARWTFRGTHSGRSPDFAPTGRPVTSTGIAIIRLDEGKIGEFWNHPDTLGWYLQLGVIDPPREGVA